MTDRRLSGLSIGTRGHGLAMRTLSLVLSLLLSGVAPLARADGPAKQSVRLSSITVGPGTPDEYVVWFPDTEGPLARGEPLRREAVRALLEHLAAKAPTPAVTAVARKLAGAQQLEDWEWRLWRDYLAYMGRRGVAVEATRQDMHPTAEDRRDMALRMALEAVLPGMAEQMAEDFSLENVAFTLMAAVTAYMVMWAAPEPITKVVAVGVTLTMLAAFGAKLLVHVVSAWKLLTEQTRQARTFAEVKAAGEHFGRQIGADGARVLFVLASLALGYRAGTLLKKLPPPPRPGAMWMAEVPGGGRVPITEVKSLTLAHDTIIVSMAAGAGRAAVASGNASTQAQASGQPSSERLAANMEAAGIQRPPGTAAHHIVAGSAPEAARARSVLSRFGVDINDAVNGVFLPANRTTLSPAPGATHSTLHTRAYYEAVEKALMRARSRQEVLVVLETIRRALLSGGFP